jgi:alcohol dehydrogenase
MTGFFTAPRIAWGTGAIQQLSGLGARRAMVVVDPAAASTATAHRVAEELGKSETTVDVVTAPSAPDSFAGVEEIAGRARNLAADWLVAVGGGRTIDAVKAARLRLVRPDVALAAAGPLVELPDPPSVRVAAVPTTSGSGAEASGTVDLWADDATPVEIAHRGLTPEWALVDPASALDLPAELVLDGALETAVQALEAYVSAWSNPFSDALALDAFTTVVGRLPHALRWSDDPDARAALHYAATAAGLASSNAQRGVAHALARALGPPTGLRYGRLLGLLLLPVLEYDRPSARERIETLASAVARGDEANRLALPARFERMYDALRFPPDLAAAGVDRALLDGARDAAVARALRSPAVLANPRVPSAADLADLIGRASGGARGPR